MLAGCGPVNSFLDQECSSSYWISLWALLKSSLLHSRMDSWVSLRRVNRLALKKLVQQHRRLLVCTASMALARTPWVPCTVFLERQKFPPAVSDWCWELSTSISSLSRQTLGWMLLWKIRVPMKDFTLTLQWGSSDVRNCRRKRPPWSTKAKAQQRTRPICLDWPLWQPIHKEYVMLTQFRSCICLSRVIGTENSETLRPTKRPSALRIKCILAQTLSILLTFLRMYSQKIKRPFWNKELALPLPLADLLLINSLTKT